MNVAKPGGPAGPTSLDGGGGSPGSPTGPASSGGPERKFADVLDNKGGPPGMEQGNRTSSPFNVPILDDVKQISQVGRSPNGFQIDRTNRVNAAPRTMEVVGERVGRNQPPGGVAPTEGGSQWHKMADGMFQSETRLDSLINQAQKGKSFTAGELMGLQIEVFRYSQTVEVISRTTDKLVGAVKQTLGTQV
jgi:hypothetical protein